ncbi:MAG: hypothetical protein GEU99_03245 [Luteitalea sp.]|nr:hypothetical protein [Luteitalea sp.]
MLSQATPERMYCHRALNQDTILDPKAYQNFTGPGTFVDTAGTVRLVSEPAEMLQRLYAAAGLEERAAFAPTLIANVTEVNARVAARTLIAIGDVAALCGVRSTDRRSIELWRGAIHALRFESTLVSDSDLDVLEHHSRLLDRWASADAYERLKARTAGDSRLPTGVGIRPTRDHPGPWEVRTDLHGIAGELRSVIARVRYLRLAHKLRTGQNPALDADRQVLLSRLHSLGFSNALISACGEIESRISTARTDIDVKSVMDLVRTFLEEVVEEASRKIEHKVGSPAPSGAKMSHYTPYRQYLENGGIIGPEESELLQKLYNFLSNQGAHRLGTAPEQLRVAYATVIEWCMLVVGRIQAYLRV